MNPNILVSQIFVDQLASSGLTDVVICPGSRSTPLTLMFEADDRIEAHLSLDERSGAFFALGMAQATGRPVAMVCTSGTAAANFYPAIIEANMSHVPLLVLTADRPPELRHSGANQTIDQVKMFGDHVLWAVDMMLPEENMQPVALRNVATTAGRAYATANGVRKGAVHCNFPFRKPLESQEASDLLPVASRPVTNVQLATSTLQPAEAHQLTDWFSRYEKGLIVCGPNCPTGAFQAELEQFSIRSGYPIFADPLSGVRFGSDTPGIIVGGYETWLAGGQRPDWDAPDFVIRFGAVPTSKWLNQYLGDIDPAVRLHVRASGVWADDSHLTTDFLQCDEIEFCKQAAELSASFGWERRKTPPYLSWQKQVLAWEKKGWDAVTAAMDQHDFDAAYLFDLIDQLPDCNLMIGNSLPVRHLDAFGRPSSKSIRLFGNRGASGIDGVVSTACGIAAAEPGKPTLLIIGDVSFYHDMNGLLAARELPNLTIVLFNNNSGSIFRRLPISKFGAPFEKHFLTAHDLDFSHTASLYSLAHHRFDERSAFLDQLLVAIESDQPNLLEIMTDGAADETVRRRLVKQVQESL